MTYENFTKQIIKNYNSDLETNCIWDKTLKYIIKKDIPYEFLFSLIAEETKSLKGLPYFLILTKKITNFDFIYKNMSLSVVFEIYNTNKEITNSIIDLGGKFDIETDKITADNISNILLRLDDNKILESIFLKNDKILTEQFKDTNSDRYRDEYSNILSYFLSKGKISTINMILFELNLDNDIINKILFSYNSESSNFFQLLLLENKIEILEKLDKNYNINYDTKPKNNFSYNEPPNISSVLNNYRDSYDKTKVIDFLISKNFDVVESYMINGDGGFDKSFNNNNQELKGYDRTYFNYIQTIRRMLNKATSAYDKTILVNKKNINYFLDNSNTIENNPFFWSLVFIGTDKGFEILKKYLNIFNDIETNYYFEYSYNNFYTKELEYLFINVNRFKENINMKDKYEDTILSVFVEKKTSKIFENKSDTIGSKEKYLEIIEIFLKNGARINDIDSDHKNINEIFDFRLKFLKNLDENFNIEFKKITLKYKDNIEEVITFDINKLKRTEPFLYVNEVMIQLKNILIKKSIYSNIEYIKFLGNTKNKDIIFEIDDTLLSFNISFISGNELDNEMFKITKINKEK